MTKQYLKLCAELQELADLAKAGEFSDFDNNLFAAPKVELVKRLRDLTNRTMEGEFDD